MDRPCIFNCSPKAVSKAENRALAKTCFVQSGCVGVGQVLTETAPADNTWPHVLRPLKNTNHAGPMTNTQI